MFIALRIFDAYITGSLRLPRNLRVIDTSNASIPMNAAFIASQEMLTASNANLELLEIMSTAREGIFLTNTTTPGQGPSMISAAQLRELSDSLDLWALKFRVYTRAPHDASTESIK
jgi:hypothetical protein